MLKNMPQPVLLTVVSRKKPCSTSCPLIILLYFFENAVVRGERTNEEPVTGLRRFVGLKRHLYNELYRPKLMPADIDVFQIFPRTLPMTFSAQKVSHT